jgi:hypothetical protein
MATAVGLNMKITADTAGIGRGMTQVEKRLASLDRNARTAARALQAIAVVQVGGAVLSGINSITSSLTSATKAAVGYALNIAKTVDQTAKLAQRTGVSVEALQGFQVAADLSGVENLQGALQKVTVVLGDAAAGSKTATKAFEAIGLSVEELMQMTPEDQFRAIASAFSAIEQPARRAAAVVDLFGRSGVELLPLFSSNLKEVEDQAKRLGIVLSQDQTSAIEEMNDALDLVRKTFDGIIGQVTAKLAPVVTDLANQFLKFVEGFESLDGTGGGAIAESIAKFISSGIESFVEVLRSVGNTIIQFGEILAKVINQVAFFAGVDLRSDLQQQFDTMQAQIAAGVAPQVSVPGTGGMATALAPEFAAEFARVQEELANEAMNTKDAISLAFNTAIDSTLGAVRNIRDQFDAVAEPAKAQSPVGDFLNSTFLSIAGFATKVGGTAAEMFNDVVQESVETQKRLAPVLKEISKVEQQRTERSAEIESQRLDELSKQSTQALEVSDVRSGGIADILRLASGREDPAVQTQREQLAELKKIDSKLNELRTERVSILSGAAV